MFDIYDDNGALLRQLYPQMNDLPEFIRKGGLPSYDHEKFASNDFAATLPLQDGIRGVYPIMSDAMTAVSCLYFEHTHQNLPGQLQKEAAANLIEACERFELSVDPDSAVAKLGTAYQEKSASASGRKIAFPSQGIGGTQYFPISTPEQVKLASSLFDKIMVKLAPMERREFSQNLIEKAAEFGVALPPTVHRWGGAQLSKALVIDAIEKRAGFMSENQRQLLYQTAQQILDMEPEKVASLLENIDDQLGLDVMYDKRIPDPRAIYEAAPVVEKMAKLAENFEMPMTMWQDACDKGVLDAFEPSVRTALRQHPEQLQSYAGTPIFEHIVDGLESLGMVERT